MFIYIHLPFCLSRCIYCDFYVSLRSTPQKRTQYLTALFTEIAERWRGQHLSPIQTVYFGGGTPALFSATQIQSILQKLGTYAPYNSQAEITMELNPERQASPLLDYVRAGINRFSMGVQSFQPLELKRLSRIHTVDDVYLCIAQARAAGVCNISLDFMYGIPTQTLQTWQHTLQQALQLNIPHLSLYGLQVEEGTALKNLVNQGRMPLPPDEDTLNMYTYAQKTLQNHGYVQYEISNWSHPGYSSRHNLNYWHNAPFWGFGVSAHGYIDSVRYQNPSSLSQYLSRPGVSLVQHGCSKTEKLENALMLGLRLNKGVFLPDLKQQYGVCVQEHYQELIQKYCESGLLNLNKGWLRFTPS